MLGQVLAECFKNDFELIAVSRSELDLKNIEEIKPFILRYQPSIVVNSSAFIDINKCEQEKDHAFLINSLIVAKMALACNDIDAKFVQISTDHYYLDNQTKKHTEEDAVTLLNTYAYTKFIGEAYALLAKNNLIIRTNIVGFNPSSRQKNFLTWAVTAIENKERLNLFKDYFSSSIDIYSFSEILKRMIIQDLKGLYNVASQDVISKADFIELLAQSLGIPLNEPTYCSVNQQGFNMVKRANSLGLDVTKVQKDLSLLMPTSQQVIDNIIKVYNESKKLQY